MDKLLSFVIPVYNVEKYLAECINSILCQVGDNCEIIIVDDGSTDSSGQIADDLKNKSQIISVIHKENGGLSSARNVGMEKAIGKYILFIDSDDRVTDGSIDQIVKSVEETECDFCFLKGKKFFPDGHECDMMECISSSNFSENHVDNIKYLASRPKYPGSACTKIYKREFLQKNNIHFPYDRRQSEDLGFILQCIYKATRIYGNDTQFYEYRQDREGSITNSLSPKTFEGLHLFISESCDMLCKNHSPIGTTEKYMMAFVAYEYLVLLYNNALSGFVDDDFCKKNIWVLRFGKSIKSRIINAMMKILGYKITSKILLRVKHGK